jgi:hypothetical protein
MNKSKAEQTKLNDMSTVTFFLLHAERHGNVKFGTHTATEALEAWARLWPTNVEYLRELE